MECPECEGLGYEQEWCCQESHKAAYFECGCGGVPQPKQDCITCNGTGKVKD